MTSPPAAGAGQRVDLVKLVDEHASAWRKAGIAKSGLILDPMDEVLLAEAREASAALKTEIKKLQSVCPIHGRNPETAKCCWRGMWS